MKKEGAIVNTYTTWRK